MDALDMFGEGIISNSIFNKLKQLNDFLVAIICCIFDKGINLLHLLWQ
jgi:hypothetical protein